MDKESKNISQIYRDGRHYDQLFGEQNDEFWLSVVREYGGPILELGCGTGKITIPLAEAGFEVTGIDNSHDMLREAEAKVKGLKLSQPIEFLRDDMINFKLQKKFGLIMLPSNNICHLHNIADTAQCFQSIKNHLTEGGVFVIDAFVPNIGILMQDASEEVMMSEYDDPDGRGKVVITTRSHYDADTQIRRNTTFQKIPGCPQVEGKLDMKMHFPIELEAALHYNGFEIVAKYGSYAKDPFDGSSNKQLIVANIK